MRQAIPERALEPIPIAASCLALAFLTASASAQSQHELVAQPTAITSSSIQAAQNANLPSAHLIREIDDPHLGSRWLLYRDPSHPGGPGRLVCAASVAPDRARTSVSVADPGTMPRAIIRAGDRVVLEENTPIVDARLQAIALNPALAGAPLQVRLEIGGKVLVAIAIARGRVALAPQPEIRP
jgi:hypothetical protein